MDTQTKMYSCPSCGGSDTETVKRRVGVIEKLTFLFIPPLVVLGFLLGFVIFIYVLAWTESLENDPRNELIGLGALQMLILPAGGGFLGFVLGRIVIRHRRKKRNLSMKTCRCKGCRAVFVPPMTQKEESLGKEIIDELNILVTDPNKLNTK